MRESRMSALAGTAFALLFFAAFVLVVSEPPEYAAADAEWTRWAEQSDDANRIGLLLMLFAGVAFLLFTGPLGRALQAGPFATTAIAGGIVGMTGLVVAIALMGLGSVGAGAFLLTLLETLRTRAFGALDRHPGAGSPSGRAGSRPSARISSRSGSVFGIGYPIGFLCLAVWTAAASLRLRAAAAASPARPLPSTR